MSVTRSATASARRAQIVTATIDVIADEGFGHATFARIAERAGLSSTRLISYHFAGKDELVHAVVTHVFERIGRHLYERVAAAADAPGRLRAYIAGNVEFIATHRAEMRALLAIVLAGGLPAEAAGDRTGESHLAAILRQGQEAGHFRRFDPTVVATAVQRSIEALPFMLAVEPDLDTAAYARELVTLFELGTRRDDA
jgi:AcrR family transcriptional regulator